MADEDKKDEQENPDQGQPEPEQPDEDSETVETEPAEPDQNEETGKTGEADEASDNRVDYFDDEDSEFFSSAETKRYPTEKLTGRPYRSKQVSTPPVDEWIERLNHPEDDCTLYLTCKDESVLEAVAWEIVEHVQLAKFNRRVLTNRINLQETNFADMLTNPESMKGEGGDPDEPTILLIRVNSVGFLRDIIDELGTTVSAQPNLWASKCRVVVLIYPKFLESTPLPENFGQRTMFWEIEPRAETRISDIPDFDNLIRNGRDADRALIFLAAFLSPIPHHLLDPLLSCLLGEREEKTGEMLADNVPEKILSIEHWRKNRRTYLENCGLAWHPGDKGRQLDFTHQQLLDAAKEALWNDFDIVLESFDQLHEAEVVFPIWKAEEIDNEFQDRLIDLAGAVIRNDTGGHGSLWLSRIVSDLVEDLRQRDQKASQDDIVKGWFMNFLSDSQRRMFCGHVSAVCAELFASDATAPIAEDFLRRLISSSGEAAWQILKRIRGVLRDEQFRKWTRDFLNQAPMTTKRNILQHLVYDAINDSQQLVQHCELVRSWLPTEDKPFQNWSQDVQLCLAFPVVLLGVVRDQAGATRFASENLPIVAGSGGAAPVDLLVDWLSHPQLPEALAKLQRRPVNAVGLLANALGELTENLAMAKKEPARTESFAVVKEISSGLLRTYKAPDQLFSRKIWKAMADESLQRAKACSAAEKSAGKHKPFLTCWEFLMQLCRS